MSPGSQHCGPQSPRGGLLIALPVRHAAAGEIAPPAVAAVGDGGAFNNVKYIQY